MFDASRGACEATRIADGPKCARRAAMTQLPVPDEVTALVQGLIQKSGWSQAATLTFLANAGANAVAKGDKIPGYRELLKAAVDHHEAEVNARKKLAAT